MKIIAVIVDELPDMCRLHYCGGAGITQLIGENGYVVTIDTETIGARCLIMTDVQYLCGGEE